MTIHLRGGELEGFLVIYHLSERTPAIPARSRTMQLVVNRCVEFPTAVPPKQGTNFFCDLRVILHPTYRARVTLPLRYRQTIN